MVAGQNGAGKTTFATEFLPHEAGCPTFVNADSIAAGLSPLEQFSVNFRAGRLLLETINEHVAAGRSFAFETTLSGLAYSRSIPNWRGQGCLVGLFYLRLPNPDMAIDRVRQRVLVGGHDVPEAVIRRRFHAGWHNFQKVYRKLVDVIVYQDSAIVYFNDVTSTLPKARYELTRTEKRKRMVAGSPVGSYWAKRQDHSSH